MNFLVVDDCSRFFRLPNLGKVKSLIDSVHLFVLSLGILRTEAKRLISLRKHGQLALIMMMGHSVMGPGSLPDVDRLLFCKF
jgi:hypothetical protein